jgi:hypothetical protein
MVQRAATRLNQLAIAPITGFMNPRVVTTIAVLAVGAAGALGLTLVGSSHETTARAKPTTAAKRAPTRSAPARPLPAPSADAVLRITGVAPGNVGATTTKLDFATIDAIATERVTVREPFLKRDVTFTGVRMSQLLRRAGVPLSARTLHMHALDDYTVDLPISTFATDGLLATRADGRPIAIAKGGPIRLIFTGDDRTASNTDNWIWSIDSMRAVR